MRRCPTCNGTGKVPNEHRDGLAPHGTHAAFNRHVRRGETPCTECVEGERAYQAERHLRRIAKDPVRQVAARRRYSANRYQERKRESLDFVDVVKVERAMHGFRVALTRAERREAVRRLAESGATASVISVRLGMSGSQVKKLLTRLRQSGAA